MRHVQLPGTDLRVTEACLGTMTFGEQNSESDAFAQLDFAVEQGINFIDTAEMYPVPPNATTQGRTETYVGNWIKARGRKARDALVIATKVAGPGRRDWIRQGRTDLTPEVIAEAVDTSLARLNIERIDLYQIHWPQRNVVAFGAVEFDPAKEREGPPMEAQVRGMAAVIAAGKVRYWGVSNETSYGLMKYRELARSLGLPPPVTTQNSYSLVSRSGEADLAEILFREPMSLLAYSPLGGGMLSGKYAGGAKPEGARFTRFTDFSLRFRKPLVAEAVDAYVALAKKRGLTPVELAIGYVRSRHFVGATIIGATTLAQLRENIQAFAVDLDAATLADIRDIQLRYPNPAA